MLRVVVICLISFRSYYMFSLQFPRYYWNGIVRGVGPKVNPKRVNKTAVQSTLDTEGQTFTYSKCPCNWNSFPFSVAQRKYSLLVFPLICKVEELIFPFFLKGVFNLGTLLSLCWPALCQDFNNIMTHNLCFKISSLQEIKDEGVSILNTDF